MLTAMTLPSINLETKVAQKDEVVRVGANELVIVDEIDNVLLDMHVTFQLTKAKNQGRVVGLTAETSMI